MEMMMRENRPPIWMMRQTEKRWTIRDLIKQAQGQYETKRHQPAKITLPKAPWEKKECV